MTALHRRLRKLFEQAVLDYQMLQQGDRLLVSVSGGADSLTLLTLFLDPKIAVTEDISLVAVHLDMGFEGPLGEGWSRLERHFQQVGCEYIMERTEIGIRAHSAENRKNPCFLCSRLRRKRLFEIGDQAGCNKIVLGHHKDDIVETFFLNVLFGREVSTMVPNQEVFSGKFRIIRPLAYIDESLLKAFAQESQLPVLIDFCPTRCTSHRALIKKMLAHLERDQPGIRNNVFMALSNVKLEYMLSSSLRKKEASL
jgi:tRNA 2-thiocytidine biosynthesis protein TtcA